MLGVVGSNLTSFKFEPTPNMSQHIATRWPNACCAQQCCDMLRWHVAIVWPEHYAYWSYAYPVTLQIELHSIANDYERFKILNEREINNGIYLYIIRIKSLMQLPGLFVYLEQSEHRRSCCFYSFLSCFNRH